MKTKSLFVMMCVLLVWGCETVPTVPTTPYVDPCPMPSGFIVEPAIETAQQTLMACPNKLDQVFMKLLEIAKHKPDKENAALIQDMFKGLIKENKVSEAYTKDLYKRYFSPKFVSLPDVKTYNLASEIDSIKRELRKERNLKRIGMVECSDNKAGYKMAEGEYARIVNLMENLVLNEQYYKENR